MGKDIAFKSKPRLKRGELIDIELSDRVFKTGRPPTFANPEEMEDKFINYLQWCEQNNKPLTRSGMALFIGFNSVTSLYDYLKNPEFSTLVNKMITFIESNYENMLVKGKNTTGAIFALKQFGWSDYRKVEHKHESRSLGAVLILTEDNNDISELTEAKVGEIIKKKVKKIKKVKDEPKE